MSKSADFGPVEVIVNDQRYVREATLFAALDRLAKADKLAEAVARHLEECCRTDIPPSTAGHDAASAALTEWEQG